MQRIEEKIDQNVQNMFLILEQLLRKETNNFVTKLNIKSI